MALFPLEVNTGDLYGEEWMSFLQAWEGITLSNVGD